MGLISKFFGYLTTSDDDYISRYIEEAQKNKNKMVRIHATVYRKVEDFIKNHNGTINSSDSGNVHFKINGIQEYVFFMKDPETGWGIVMIEDDNSPESDGKIHDFRLVT